MDWLVDAQDFQTNLSRSVVLEKWGTCNEHVIPFCVFSACIMALYFTRLGVLVASCPRRVLVACLSQLYEKHTLLDRVLQTSNSRHWRLVFTVYGDGQDGQDYDRILGPTTWHTFFKLSEFSPPFLAPSFPIRMYSEPTKYNDSPNITTPRIKLLPQAVGTLQSHWPHGASHASQPL